MGTTTHSALPVEVQWARAISAKAEIEAAQEAVVALFQEVLDALMAARRVSGADEVYGRQECREYTKRLREALSDLLCVERDVASQASVQGWERGE